MKTTINLETVKSLTNLGILPSFTNYDKLKGNTKSRVRLSSEDLGVTKQALSYLADSLSASKIYYSTGAHAYKYYVSKEKYRAVKNILNIMKNS